MRVYPVMGLFSEVGTVRIEQEGLYLRFDARLSEPISGVSRLYFHGESTVRIATFSSKKQASGRISCRSLGAAPEKGAFSVLPDPWKLQQIPDFAEPVSALRTADGRLAAFPIGAKLPDAAVSRFCFLVRSEVCGIPCWLLKLDEAGNPQLNL